MDFLVSQAIKDLLTEVLEKLKLNENAKHVRGTVCSTLDIQWAFNDLQRI